MLVQMLFGDEFIIMVERLDYIDNVNRHRIFNNSNNRTNITL